MQNGILFDNIYVGHSEEDAKAFADETWALKHKIEKELEGHQSEKSETVSNIFDIFIHLFTFFFFLFLFSNIYMFITFSLISHYNDQLNMKKIKINKKSL